MSDCLFCNIANGTIPCHKVWEDENHLAFLTIFPNTDGGTVVIPKKHADSYVFNVESNVMHNLIDAAKTVAKKIDTAFSDVGRTAMVFEGFGVNHLHAKLYPLHGTKPMSEWKPIISIREFEPVYQGRVSTHDCERADDAKLSIIAKKIRDA
jgi:diadenosine tetraphosphate (Ap4A) HIT family hydrolase